MKRKDAKIGMQVVVTGRNDVAAWMHDEHKKVRQLQKGDIVTITALEGHSYEDRFLFVNNADTTQSFPYSEVEPVVTKIEMPNAWRCRVETEATRLMLRELGEKNGYVCGYSDDNLYWICGGDVFSNHTDFVFESKAEFGGYEKYTEIALYKVVEFLSIPKDKPLKLGGKKIKIDRKTNEVEIAGQKTSIAKLREIYNEVKRPHIFVGEHQVLVNYKNQSPVSVTVGCTTATIEEIETLAKKLGFTS